MAVFRCMILTANESVLCAQTHETKQCEVLWHKTCQLPAIGELIPLYPLSAALVEVYKLTIHCFFQDRIGQDGCHFGNLGEIPTHFDVSEDAKYWGNKDGMTICEIGLDVRDNLSSVSWLCAR